MCKVYFSLFFSIIVFISCTKEKEQEKITGSWSKVFLRADEAGNTLIWTFDENNNLYSTKYSSDTTILDTASFVIDKDFPSTFYIDFTGLKEEEDGRYQVIKLNKTILVLERIAYPDGKKEGAYLWKEFVKKTD